MSEKPSAKGGSLRSDVYFLFLGWSLGGYTKEHDEPPPREHVIPRKPGNISER